MTQNKTQSTAQRILIEHRYRTELPFPMSTVFYHYSCSPTKNNAIRASRLVRAAESTLRYAAIVAACDYVTDPAADKEVLKWLKDEWLGGRALSFGHWSNGLMKVLKELGKTWQTPFLPEFGKINTKRLNAAIEPLVNARNKQLAHAERFETLSYQHFIREHEENLFAILEQLEFLSKYPLCFAEVEEDDELPAQGSKQTINLCRGASRSFTQCTVTPSHPIISGVPFVWNSEFNGILTLSPLFIYGRATTESQTQKKKQKSSVTAFLQGLMVLNSTRGAGDYASLDEEVNFSFDAFIYPFPDDIRKQVDGAFEKDSRCPFRFETSLTQEEKEQFGRQPGDVPVGSAFKGEKDTYIVEREPVGRGGMGVVYLVRRQSDNLLCALKAMPLELMTVGSLVRRFVREGRVLLDLSKEANPNIVRLLDVGYQEPYHFLVMEYVEGGSLGDELWLRSGKKPPYTFGEALDVIEQICNGVAAIHSKKIIHRDIKPANMLLAPQRDKDGAIDSVIVKVTDFGLARRVGQQSIALTMELGALGTFEYMPPEQFEDMGQPISEKADIYAIGKILAQMLTGVIPRNAEEVKSLDFTPLMKQESDDNEASTETTDDCKVPIEGIRDILTCCLAKDPEERFETVADPNSRNSLIDALRKASRIDEAGGFLNDLGVLNPDVRAAFGLAKIGHPQARKRLLDWCAHQEDSRHNEAVLALVALDDKGLGDLIDKAEQASSTSDPEKEQSLVHALSCALRWKEDVQPRTLGQKWLAKLSVNLRRRVKKAYISENLQNAKKDSLRIATWYGGVTAVFAALGSLPGCAIGGNVLWRTFPDGSKTKFLLYFFGSMITGVLWGCLFPLGHFLGKQFERPRRFWVIFLAGLAGCFLSTLAIWMFAQSQGIGALAEACGGPANAVNLLSRYFITLSVLCSIGILTYFLTKEIAAVKLRLPWALFSFAALPVFLTMLCALTVPLFIHTSFTITELVGELGIVLGTAFGIGIADYLLDRRNLRRSVDLQQ